MSIPNKLPEFNLIGTDDQMHSSQEHQGKQGHLIFFVCNHCPSVIAYVDRIKKLVQKYGSQIGIFAISSNDVEQYPADSFQNMVPMGKELGLDGKYLFDESQQIAKTFEAQRTPEAYLYNKEGQLVYHGAIDDNRDMPSEVSQHYLDDAIGSMLSGDAITTKDTPLVGCTIKWKN